MRWGYFSHPLKEGLCLFSKALHSRIFMGYDVPSCSSPFYFVPLRSVLTPLHSAHTMSLFFFVDCVWWRSRFRRFTPPPAAAPTRSSHHASHRARRCFRESAVFDSAVASPDSHSPGPLSLLRGHCYPLRSSPWGDSLLKYSQRSRWICGLSYLTGDIEVLICYVKQNRGKPYQFFSPLF